MRMIGYSAVVAVIAVLFLALSLQGVRAEEMKIFPPLEVPAGSAAQMHNSEGIKQYNGGKWEEAEKHFNAAIKVDDKAAEAHYNLALALDKLGKHKEAKQEYDRARKLDPNNPAITISEFMKKHP